MPSVSLVIPAYNEEAGLAATAGRCLSTLSRTTDDWEVVMLDDHSTDRTYEIMEDVQRVDPRRIRIARHPVNLGIARTFEDLYRMATKDFVFLIPADGEYPPEVLAECMPLLDDHDIVLCRRRHKNYTPTRHAVSVGFQVLPRLLFGVDLFDPGTVKCMRREIIQRIPTISRGVFVEAERLIRALKCGYRMAVVEIVQEPRRGGIARGASLRLVREALYDLVSVWFHLQILRESPGS
jgi:glycosyltransferase involved in cell wall biosynthesis